MFGIDDAIIAAAAPAVIGGVMDMFGNQQTNSANAALMNQANAFNQAQSEKQMAFQKEMRATQYQTAVEDMQKAGLNPMLAYMQGGAGNLSGSSASSITPQPVHNKISGLMSGLKQGAVIASQIKQANLDNVETESRIGVNDKQRQKLDADTAETIARIPVHGATVSEKEATVKSLLNGIRLQNSHIGVNSAREAAIHQDINIRKPDEWANFRLGDGAYGKLKKIGGDVATGVNSAASAVNSLRGRTVNINNPTYNRTQYLDRE